jgi:hypothetical protein
VMAESGDVRWREVSSLFRRRRIGEDTASAGVSFEAVALVAACVA